MTTGDTCQVSKPARAVVAVVDDDHRVRESLQDLLEQAGHGVCSFATAKALLDASEVATIDCLITDIGMPEMDGFELQHLLRRLRPSLPVILITGKQEYASRKHEADRGGRPLFQKPFDTKQLLSTIDIQLRASRGNK